MFRGSRGSDRPGLLPPRSNRRQMLERGEVTSVELVECYLARIDALNPRLNSYITVAADHARAAAADADARRAARGRALAVSRRPDLDQGPCRHRRHREHARHRRVARPGAGARRRGDREAPGRGIRVPRQDRRAGVRAAQHQRAPGLPAGAQPVEPRAQLWRFVGRCRGGPGRRGCARSRTAPTVAAPSATRRRGAACSA